MISLSFDLTGFELAARRLGGAIDQLPFAMSKALNDAADRTRERLATETWPRGVIARDKNFMKAALTTKGQRATKHNLRVTIYDKLNRASLVQHERGGMKASRRNLAVPTSRNVQPRRGAKGVPKNLRPMMLDRSFRRGDSIYQRGPGKKHKTLRLMYVLKPSAQIRPAVPFHADFARFMRQEVVTSFPKAMRQAMATRRGQ